MKIEIWSDVVCPFWYIGERRLFAAMDELPYKDELEVSFKSFELDPNASFYTGKSIEEAISEKYGVSIEQARGMNQNIIEQAKEVGLDFNFSELKPTNTLSAHRLIKFAKSQGKELAMSNRLFKEYFEEGALVSDTETLVRLAVEVGLLEVDVRDVLADDSRFLADVRADETTAQQYGITSVPYIVVNDKYAIKGAQPVETFKGAIETAWSELTPKSPFQEIAAKEGMICDENGCEIPK